MSLGVLLRDRICVMVISQVGIRVIVRNRVTETLHDLFCLYSLSQVMLKLSQIIGRGHFMMLI